MLTIPLRPVQTHDMLLQIVPSDLTITSQTIKAVQCTRTFNIETNQKKNNFLSGNISHKENVKVSHPVVTPLSHPSDSSQTYAQVTSGLHPNNTISPLASDINKFLEEFKLLINPLIALLTKVISMLLDKN